MYSNVCGCGRWRKVAADRMKRMCRECGVRECDCMCANACKGGEFANVVEYGRCGMRCNVEGDENVLECVPPRENVYEGGW